MEEISYCICQPFCSLLGPSSCQDSLSLALLDSIMDRITIDRNKGKDMPIP